jgi:hypothetical protein|tara:strand:+ start:591 stop:764 length:174 start_codon:yes stop_codon:yes gene_type:complete
MKLKLKANQMLTMKNSYSGFSMDNYYKLNAGKTVEVDAIPVQAVGLVEEVKTAKDKK